MDKMPHDQTGISACNKYMNPSPLDDVRISHSPGTVCPEYSFVVSPSLKLKRAAKSCILTDESEAIPLDSSLSLGLACYASPPDSKMSSMTACTTVSSVKEIGNETLLDVDMGFDLLLGSKKMNDQKRRLESLQVEKPDLDLELSLSTGTTSSDVTSIVTSSTPFWNSVELSAIVDTVLLVDEGSTSAKWNLRQLGPPQDIDLNLNPPTALNQFSPTVVHVATMPTTTKGSVSKICQVMGCGKGARGASGLCISHGGGRRCQRVGCPKGAEGKTAFCKAHGGGRRCQHLGCTMSAEGRTDFCIAHGGGKRCSHDGCTRAARGKSGFCIRHGGGKRCQRENCTKSAEGLSGLCISHGGGRRCQKPGCTKGAQGSTMFCKAHGGGKRCTAPGCTKGAEGSTPFCKGHGGGKRCSFEGGGVCPKSVHGGTLFCVRHGGGKRCATPGCLKSARGRTSHCVRHGGGKRCQHAGCPKSAQGSTDYCKAHGGGKRCTWGQLGSNYGGSGTAVCVKFARGKSGLCTVHSMQMQDKKVNGGITLGPRLCHPEATPFKKMKEAILSEDCTVNGLEPSLTEYAYQQNLVDATFEDTAPIEKDGGIQFSLPEGRVHGGSLMAMLAGGSLDKIK